jgi:type I restriction enzyme R subunit
MVIESFEKIKVALEPESARYINACLVKEYTSEYQGIQQW